MSLFEEFEKRMKEFSISNLNEPDPICDCYANNSNDCFYWDFCKQRIEYKELKDQQSNPLY
jgi:hypothetical protein